MKSYLSIRASIDGPGESLCYYPLRPNHHRRANWHDYKAPASYLLTMSKNPAIPRFSFITGSDLPIDCAATDHRAVTDHRVEVQVNLTPVGEALEAALCDYTRDYPMTEIRRHVVMPDHIHLLVHVPSRMERPLGFYISKFMGRVTRYAATLIPTENGGEMTSVFTEGFNDRILNYMRSWSVWENYVADNPRRLWLMQNRRQFFERGEVVLSGGRVFPTYGNALLLDYPEKEIVRFSRRFSAEEWEQRKVRVMRTAENGGVLVSPFIHPNERELRDRVLEAGGRIIHVVESPFASREKPSRREFELCAEGRALIIARLDGGRSDDTMTRDIAMKLNRMSEWIVETTALSRFYHSH